MRLLLIFTLYFLSPNWSVAQIINRKYVAQYPDTLRIQYYIQSDKQGVYRLEWLDTLGQPKGENMQDNAFELYCYVRDSTGIIGVYKDGSRIRSCVKFKTDDTSVSVYYQKRYYSKDSVVKKVQYQVEQEIDLVEYRPIKIKLKDATSGIQELVPNPRIVLLIYYTQPRVINGLEFLFEFEGQFIMALDRYYLDPASGVIRTGQSWLETMSSNSIIYSGYKIVDPNVVYGKRKYKLLGKDLIKRGKIDLEIYDNQEFKMFIDSNPY